MQKTRCVVANTFLSRTTPLVLALSALAAMCSTTYAAQLGHARIVSQQGQPLRIAVPVTQLSQQDARSFAVAAAPISDWKQAGLIPPVDPATLSFQLVDGARPNVRTIQIESPQPFNGPVADLLLNVQTATGRQHYQVSILAPLPAAGVAMPGASQGGAGTSTGSATAPKAAAARSIRVRRGDTMFSIARRHAVPQASVYQMMIALQRANPQAFIHGNINLVKAGATLKMPDPAQIDAVSDQEARRIFMRQAQEFEQYRQGLAGKKGQAVAGGPAEQGRLSTEAPAPDTSQAVAQNQDKVVLSSNSATDKAADEHTAAGKSLADSQERISQLEQNVKNLNQALQGQGQAAKDVLVEGAAGLGQTLTEAAGSLSGNSSESPASDATGPQPKPASASTDASAGSGSSAAGSGTQAAAAGQSVGAAQPSPAGQPQADDSKAINAIPGAATSGAKGSTAAPEASKNTVDNASNKAEHSVSWFQEHLLGVVTALLALAVLIIAWVLRRANAAREDDYPASPVTEAMVQEKLDKINLDLREPPVNDGR